jgi:hypothetical protein
MAKGQKRSGREPKKPKAGKRPVATASVSNRPPPLQKPPPKSDNK